MRNAERNAKGMALERAGPEQKFGPDWTGLEWNPNDVSRPHPCQDASLHSGKLHISS